MNPAAGIHTEKISFGYSASREVTEQYALHCHNFYEIYYFIEGDVDYLVEGQHYKPTANSLLLLSPHAFHGVRINSALPYKRYSLHFHPELLSQERRAFLLRSFPQSGRAEERPIYFEHAEKYRLPVFLESLEECGLLPEPFREQMLPIRLEALLSEIAAMSIAVAPDARDRLENTVTDILFYINKHLSEPLTLDDISEHFYISKHHLNKVFRKATGTTVMDYLLRKRVVHAQLLLNNGCHAKDAAFSSGFGDYSSFYRAYVKTLGHTPGKDRGTFLAVSEQMRQETVIVHVQEDGL